MEDMWNSIENPPIPSPISFIEKFQTPITFLTNSSITLIFN